MVGKNENMPAQRAAGPLGAHHTLERGRSNAEHTRGGESELGQELAVPSRLSADGPARSARARLLWVASRACEAACLARRRASAGPAEAAGRAPQPQPQP